MEKSGVDLLIENLKSLGLKPETNEENRKFNIVQGSDRLLNKKFVVAVVKDCFFIAYDSYGTSAGSSNSFTGIYTISKFPKNLDVVITGKSLLDKLLVWGKYKTGVDYIDKSLIIKSKDPGPLKHLKKKDVDLFLSIHDEMKSARLVVKRDYIPFFSPLKDKMIAGVEVPEWIYSKKQVQLIIDQGTQLLNALNLI